MTTYLESTQSIDGNHPRVTAFSRDAAAGAHSPQQKAVALFYAVRDGIRYNPYAISTCPEDFRASAVIAKGEGFCVPKSILLAAVARSAGIPARLGFADVRNHLTTRRLREAMGTDLFVFHGYTELMIEDRWVKATCAFNRSLCEKFGILPLDFDGIHDSLLHPFDRAGNAHMEYVRDHGTFADFPYEMMMAAFAEAYPHWAAAFDGAIDAPQGDFEKEREEDDRKAGM
jgi:hypothetical protein